MKDMYQLEGMNCNRCEKCLRTIVSLLIAGIDPEKCGFRVDSSTFKLIRLLFEERAISELYLNLLWKPLQDDISPEIIEEDAHGSKEFLSWFKTIDVLDYKKPEKNLIEELYYRTPFRISNYLRKIFHDPKTKLVSA
jgi:hypothetical protein